MTESRTKAAEGYLMRSTFDNSVVEMDPSTAHRAMTQFEPGHDKPMFVPVGPVPGFTFKDDGGTVATTFDPETALRVAQQYRNKKYPHRLAFGKEDPGFEAAKVYRDDQTFRHVGANKGFFEVFGERLADVATFGAFGAIADENEDESRIRAYQNQYNPFASIAGTFGGIGVGLLFPYGTAASALGKGAMAAGRASGIVRASKAAQVASSGGKPIKNLLQLTARAADVTADVLKAKGKGQFTQNFGGGLVSLAVAEAPLSLAIASADIVDYNKDFSAQALVADAGALWLTGMAFGGAVSFTGAAFRSGARGLRRSVAKPGARKSNDLLDFGLETIGAGFRRASYRGTGPFEGAAKIGFFRRFIIEPIRKASRSRAAKVLTGESVIETHMAGKTIREVLEELRASRISTGQKLVDSAGALRHMAKTDEVAAFFQRVIDNPKRLLGGAEAFNITRKQFYGIYMKEFDRLLPTKLVPPKLWKAGGAKAVKAEVKVWAEQIRAQSKNGNPFAAQQAELSERLLKISKQMDGNNALKKLYDAEKAAMKAGDIGIGKHEVIRNAVDKLTKGDSAALRYLNDLEMWSKSADALDEIFQRVRTADDWVHGVEELKQLGQHVENMRIAGEGFAGLSKRAREKLAGDADFMTNDVIRDGLLDVAALNKARRAGLEDVAEFGGYRSVLEAPMGPHGPLTELDEILEQQIDSVMSHKKATGSALRSLVFKGAPRGAATFAGVLAYRQMTQDIKRQNFNVIRETVLNTSASPELLIDAIGRTAGKLAVTDMPGAVAYGITLATANSYMMQQMPRSSDPLIGPLDYSMQEVDSYLEMIGALESPASVIASARDGSVSIEAVDAIRTVYPELYTDMILDIVEFMQTRDWDKLNQNQKLGLDTFTGGALGILRSYGPPVGPLSAQTPMQQQALGTNNQQSNPDMARLQQRQNSTASQKVGAL